MKTLYTVLVFLTVLLTSTSALAELCPHVVFAVDENFSSDCHGNGHVQLNLVVCAVPDQQAYVLDSVLWNMGDGNPLVKTNGTQIDYTYTTTNGYNVIATAYFTVGETTCSTTAKATDHSGDWCSSAETDAFLVTRVMLISASLYSFQPTPVTAGSYGVKLDYVTSVSPFTYEVTIDGTSVGSGSSLTASPMTVYSGTLASGQHLAEIVLVSGKLCVVTASTLIEVPETTTESGECLTCLTFRPDIGKRYWASAWVRQDTAGQVLKYTGSALKLTFNGSSTTTLSFAPAGDIIEGWQRITADFTVPAGTTSMTVNLYNGSANQAYFDDIRIHPFNASMKTYVYDADTFWLTAELDDNNYATFYEYDKEGQLIRVKKETEKGIVTLQESRSANPKHL